MLSVLIGGIAMVAKTMEALGYALLVIEAAALAFLIAAWIRDQRNANG